MADARTDAALLSAVRGGDRAALEELLGRHEQRIYRFGLRMCGDEDSAREVLQETLLAAFRNLREVRGDSSLSTWLYQVAKSFCIKQRRKARPGGPLGDDDAVAAGALPDAQLHAREIGAALAAGIDALPDEQREALVLRDVEGLSAEDAAAVAGVEIGALKSRLHRARLELRRRLAALVDDAPAPCPELAQTLSAYVAAEIDQAACLEIERHLESCPRCRGACEGLQRTVSLCRSLPGDGVPAAVRAAVRDALRAALDG
jgi:RNA polymerase sigma-70 factor (ECF subfamily)